MRQLARSLALPALLPIVGLVGPLVATAHAQAPRIESLGPSGVQRGVATDLVVTGANLAEHPRWLCALGAGVEPLPGSDAKSWRVRVRPDPDAAVGVYLVRVQTDAGVSNPFPLAVDQVPHVAEVEENGTIAGAQRVSGPVVIEGQAGGSDVDYFRFAGHRGERVVIDAQCARIGSGVDPSLRLLTSNRRPIASADDTPGLVTDARIVAELPLSGDYLVELVDSRYQGAGPRTNYRLLIGPDLPVAGTVFPLGGPPGAATRFEVAGALPSDGAARTVELALSSAGGSGVFGPVPVGLEERALGGGLLAAEAHVGSGGWVGRQADAAPLVVDPLPEALIEGGGWAGRHVEAVPPLVVDPAPHVFEPTDPNAPPSRAPGLPVVLHGRIERPGDLDSFVVPVPPGQKVRVVVRAASLGSLLDGTLTVTNPKGGVLGSFDDSQIPLPIRPKPAAAGQPAKTPILLPDPEAVVAVPGDVSEINVGIKDLQGNGGPNYPYLIRVEALPPSFDLAITSGDQVNIPRGGTASISVEADRRDLPHAITLNVANPPPGVTVRPGLIPLGQTVGHLTVSAAADAQFDAARLDIRGESFNLNPPSPVVVAATRTTVLAQQGEFVTSYVEAPGLLAAPGNPAPIALTGPEAVEVVLAYSATIPVRAVRLPGAEDAVLTFAVLPTVANLAVAPDPKLAAKATEGTITLNTNPDLPAGRLVLVFTAKGKVGDRERTFTLPAINVDVVYPADATLSAPRLEIPAGQTAEVKGRITRRGPFKEPVTVSLDKLPAGLKADPVTVAPDAADFTLKLQADPKAAPAEAPAQVKLAYKLGPRDYSPPPVALTVKINPAPAP